MTNRNHTPDILKDDDDLSVNPTTTTTIGTLVAARLSRRGMLKGLMATTAAAGAASLPLAGAKAGPATTLRFKGIAQTIDADHHVAEGYRADVLIRWGDPVEAGAPAWQPGQVDPAAQATQFGYNNDFIAYMPLPRGSKNSDRGLLCVNHEYTNAELMWPGMTQADKLDRITDDQARAELTAHGHTVIEITKQDGLWQVVDGSRYNRRITTGGTEMVISGPAAGHDRLKTSADPTGTVVIGTVNNCAGGVTPWGTVLTAEENFHGYFGGDPAATAEAANYKRYGLSDTSRYAWHRVERRFDVDREPNEPNRFGWIVEIDPYTPDSRPVKRTALGRFKHEGATTVVNKDGRVVLYSGDDQRFEYIYKFVTNRRFDPDNLAANRDLLDDGTLYVGRFDADGGLEWLPLVFGQEPLRAENGFNSQADVSIETRRAADLLGATPMDRPEDVEPNPINGRVYANLTNNSKRKPDGTDAANPRGPNTHGTIIEMIPPGGAGADADHAATRFTWEILILAGNPAVPEDKAVYHPQAESWLSSPDNMAFDRHGRMWIATDQGSKQRKTNIPDGIHATDLDGPGRALTRFFYACPKDAEMCGPEFTPDNKTLFVGVQHPGEGKDSSFDAPTTRWPDFKDDTPPRPSVVAITHIDGADIGA